MQLYDANCTAISSPAYTEGSFLAEFSPYSKLSYEHMLSSRYALYNAAPHGRDWSLDRSATLLLSRLDVEGPMSVSELADALSRRKIAVRGGLHCAPGAHSHLGTLRRGAVRASIGHANTSDEVDQFLRAIYEISRNGA